MEIVKTINGKKRGFKFTMLTLQYFSDHTGVEFSEIIEHLQQKTLGSIVILLLSANTVYTKGKNGQISKFDVDEWISHMDQSDLQDVWDVFMESTQQIIGQLPKAKDVKKK